MEFKFDPHQMFQRDAIDAVADLFYGQPVESSSIISSLKIDSENAEALGMLDMANEVGAFGNYLLIDRSTILHNLQAVQDRNGLEVASDLAGETLDFDVEMETGTGKTYVYLRTIFELSKKYNFSKFSFQLK